MPKAVEPKKIEDFKQEAIEASVRIVLKTFKLVHEKLIGNALCADALVVNERSVLFPAVSINGHPVFVRLTRTSMVFYAEVSEKRHGVTLKRDQNLSAKQVAEIVVATFGHKGVGKAAVRHVLDHLFTNLVKAIETLPKR